jgi:hypothetical protein
VAQAETDSGSTKAGLPLQELTCEARWIRRGRFGDDVAAWFSQFPHMLEVREDDYLVDPRMLGLSVKIRGGSSFDVKQHRGEVGAIDVAGGAGSINSWFKFSFPLLLPQIAGPSQPLESSAWRRIRKRRQIASFPMGAPGDPASVCSVELTEVETLGDAWWTLGFEARGTGALEGIELTTSRILAEPLPSIAAFTAEESRSYGEWIHELA